MTASPVGQPAASQPQPPRDTALAAARLLAILIPLVLVVSPPLATLMQLVLASAMLALGPLRRRLLASLRHPAVVAALLLFAWVSLGAAYSDDPARALKSWLGWRKLLLFVLAFALLDAPRWKLQAAWLLVAASSLAAMASFWGFFLDMSYRPPLWLPGTVVRNHAAQGMVFALAAFVSGALALMAPGLSRGRQVAALAAAALLALNVLFVTPSRAGYLTLLVYAGGLLIVKVAQSRQRWRTLGGGSLVILALAASLAAGPQSRERILVGIQETLQHAQAEQITAMGVRILFWKNTAELITERPLLGWGTGGYVQAYQRAVEGRAGLAGLQARDPHNQYLFITAENGLVGLALFLGWLLACARQPQEALWRILGLGALAGWCITSLANSHFSTSVEATLLFTWLGCMLAVPPRPATGPAPQPP